VNFPVIQPIVGGDYLRLDRPARAVAAWSRTFTPSGGMIGLGR